MKVLTLLIRLVIGVTVQESILIVFPMNGSSFSSISLTDSDLSLATGNPVMDNSCTTCAWKLIMSSLSQYAKSMPMSSIIASISALPLVMWKGADSLLKKVIVVARFASLRIGSVIMYAAWMILVVALCASVTAQVNPLGNVACDGRMKVPLWRLGVFAIVNTSRFVLSSSSPNLMRGSGNKFVIGDGNPML